MTKQDLRAALKGLAADLEATVKYERAASVTLPTEMIAKWQRRLLELSEDDLLWT